MVATVRGRAIDGTLGLVREIDACADRPPLEGADPRIDQAMLDAARQLAQCVPRREGPPHVGYLVANPFSHVHRAVIDMPALPRLPKVQRPVYAAGQLDDHQYVVVDVPPMGFAWISAEQAAKPPRRPPKPLAEETRLFNEYFELHVNPQSGALQSLFDYEKRGNRLSQQLAVRASVPQRASGERSDLYSRMVADDVRITAASTVLGEITATGKLVSQAGEALAHFQQRYRVWRGSRVLELDVEIEPLAELDNDPWNSYYGCRFAWASESAFLWRGVNQLRERAEAKRLEAPSYIDIDDDGHHTTLLPAGLPFHRRTDLRMLDTLLIVKGEGARSFQLGIGVNLSYPLNASVAQLVPLPAIQVEAAAPAGPSSSWLFHVDSRNVLATSWTPVVEGDSVVGVRVRLLETVGRSARARLKAFRPILRAERHDFQQQMTGTCPVEDDAALVQLGANEWTEVVARWDHAE